MCRSQSILSPYYIPNVTHDTEAQVTEMIFFRMSHQETVLKLYHAVCRGAHCALSLSKMNFKFIIILFVSLICIKDK